MYQKQKPTGTKCDDDIEIIEKYRKRISIINREKKLFKLERVFIHQIEKCAQN